MSIENDIKQKSFKSPYHRLIVNLLYTSNWIFSKQSGIFKEYDLSSQQYNVLRILRGSYPKPVKVNSIMERMLDKTSNVSRLVDKLLDKKLVERKVCENDRRAVNISITGEGLRVLSEIDPLNDEFSTSFDHLSEEEAISLSFLLDKLRKS